MEMCLYLIICFVVECEDFSFPVDDESEGYRLNSAGRKLRLDLSPEYGRELESDKSVENSSCLLGIDKVHVDLTGILDCVEDRRLCDFLKYDSSGLALVKPQRFEKMP